MTNLVMDLMASEVVVCSGVGKSGRVAALAADLLHCVGIKAQFVHPVDLLHGSINLLPQTHLCSVILFTHSGHTEEIRKAAFHVGQSCKSARTVVVTAGAVSFKTNYALTYMAPEEDNKWGTIPVQASIAQISTIGDVVNQIANLATPNYLRRGHPDGHLARVYEEICNER